MSSENFNHEKISGKFQENFVDNLLRTDCHRNTLIKKHNFNT